MNIKICHGLSLLAYQNFDIILVDTTCSFYMYNSLKGNIYISSICNWIEI